MKKLTKNKSLLLLISITLLSILLLISIPISKTYPKHYDLHFHLHNNLHFAQSHCHGTLYPDLCISTLSRLCDLENRSMAEILCHTLNITLSEVTNLKLDSPVPLSSIHSWPLSDCQELLESTIDDINTAYADITRDITRFLKDIQTTLSAGMTSMDTCVDGLNIVPYYTTRSYFEPAMLNISRHLSNSLALLKKTSENSHFEDGNTVDRDGFPVWLKKRDRRLLQVASGGRNKTVFYDLMVAQDGTGNFTTINEAVAVLPTKSDKRFVVYIKAGAYFEYVEVDKKKTNIMFLGDGFEQTWFKGNRSVKDNYTTFNCATLSKFSNNTIMIQ